MRFELIQLRIELGAAHRGAVDVHGDHAAGMARREHRTDTGARAQVEHLRTGAEPLSAMTRCEERAGAQQSRIEHRRQDQQRRAVHVLETNGIVAVRTGMRTRARACCRAPYAAGPGRVRPAAAWQRKRSQRPACALRGNCAARVRAGSRYIEHTQRSAFGAFAGADRAAQLDHGSLTVQRRARATCWPRAPQVRE